MKLHIRNEILTDRKLPVKTIDEIRELLDEDHHIESVFTLPINKKYKLNRR